LRLSALAAANKARLLAGVAATPLECTELFGAVQACEKIPGDMAEAGVYRGGGAAVMLAASASKHIHLFDTFEGMPQAEGGFARNEYLGTLDEVSNNLKTWKGRFITHKGFFPDSAVGLESLRFSFVQLDLDLYKSTLDALEWFWPRLNSGGILLSHDYPQVDGVVEAFHEFFDQRPEPFIPLSGNNCMAVKP
jgi:hypothetical protein